MFSGWPDFDPCVAIIPLKSIHELRGKVERWPNCNASLVGEMEFIGRLLVSISGLPELRGPIRGRKRIRIDFRAIFESARVNMDTEGYWG